MGYQYELLKSFADYLDVKLEIKIINDIDEGFQCMEKYMKMIIFHPIVGLLDSQSGQPWRAQDAH